ncbi:ubiquitin-protein ligase E3A [Drosophila ficusphila]|uniref:ubiquitin-protein ligase E3A n=1 Tax=Drosophila ficusphila TaxID=30025 RepID=UPI0007E7AA0C|nr:ubiquitin-protein ligase E3A [Drosophila ficusphila]
MSKGGGGDEEQHLPGVSSASGPRAGTVGGRATPEMKRSAVRSLIQRYFHQLQTGCGNAHCTNANCASSGQVAPMTPNEVAARALQLFSQDAQLCEAPSSATSSPQDVDMLSPNDSSSSSSGSSTSTITSASTTTTTSRQSQSTPAAVVVAVSSPNPVQSVPSLDLGSVEPTFGDSEPCTPTLPPVHSLDADSLIALYEQCKAASSYDRIWHAIGDVFSNLDRLSKSFIRSEEPAASSSLQELLTNPPEALNKEQLRTLEGEHDKDEDSTQQVEEGAAAEEAVTDASPGPEIETKAGTDEEDDDDVPMAQPTESTEEEDPSQSSDTQVDLPGLRRVQRILFDSQQKAITEMLTSSVIELADSVTSVYRNDVPYFLNDWEKVIHCLVICFDLATNTKHSVVDLDYSDRVLPKLCHAAAYMPVPGQARLARIWAAHCSDQLHSLVAACQQQITLQVLLDEESMRENGSIISMTKVLKIVFFANILASELERPSCRVSLEDRTETAATSASGSGAVEEDLFAYNSVLQPHMPKFAEDQLEKALQVSAIDCRQPLVPLEEFYNEALSENIQMHYDYLSYKTLAMEDELGSGRTNYFSFMLYAFILTPATKVDALYYDSRMRMYSERYSSLYSILNNFGQDGNDGTTRPDLKLTVRRDQLINDALIGLEMVAMSNPKDLKKQLVVEFVGEQGIDEGGVSKEFFQLIVEEIFNPAFGMFIQQEETNNMWFNATPFENGAQFTLIGIIIGLAIYNNVILAVNFPMVVYRKLMGYRGTFADLSDWSPTLYKSLKSMLDYQGQDMEEVFDQTFKISYSNVFGEMVEHELLPNGNDVLVGQHNKRQFVNLYSDFLLNTNIKQQFNAFRKGFEMVTDESPLKLLFRPQEIEMLVCGSREFDFVELEHSTEYEGGYTEKTQIIQDFWSIVHAMSNESKRKLLEFTTGSARVPVGGLKCLRLLITRHGPDSDRLPTSHTCFNVLLLPEYDSREKLEERLMKAINYSKGFGML